MEPATFRLVAQCLNQLEVSRINPQKGNKSVRYCHVKQDVYAWFALSEFLQRRDQIFLLV